MNGFKNCEDCCPDFPCYQDFAHVCRKSPLVLTYEAEYRACVQACAWMVEDKTLHVELGKRYTVEGVAALRAQRDRLLEENKRAVELGKVCDDFYAWLMKLHPWSESNDMDWEDELNCGMGIAEREVEELRAENAALRDALAALKDIVDSKRNDPENVAAILNGALKLAARPTDEG